MTKRLILAVAAMFVLANAASRCTAADRAASPQVKLERDGQKSLLRVMIDGNEAIVYRYASEEDLVHYYPVRGPSGKSMTVEHPDRFPHHRSFWVGDRVQLAGGRAANFYAPYYSCADRKNPKPPFKDHVRHVEFLPESTVDGRPVIRSKLVWEMENDKPVLDEMRAMRVVPLGGGEYFLDVAFTVTAAHGDVTFTSDWVHYAWPYIRMNKRFCVQGGGTITSSTGGVNQKKTNGKPARWMDYSNTVDGKTEGLAIFSHPDNAQPHKWLTRAYGCFGPRRVDKLSGTKFTLKKNESLKRRVGILVHRGDAKTGQVAQRYKMYVDGKL